MTSSRPSDHHVLHTWNGSIGWLAQAIRKASVACNTFFCRYVTEMLGAGGVAVVGALWGVSNAQALFLEGKPDNLMLSEDISVSCNLTGVWLSLRPGTHEPIQPLVHIEIQHTADNTLMVRTSAWEPEIGHGRVSGDHDIFVAMVGGSGETPGTITASDLPEFGTDRSAPDCTYLSYSWCKFPYSKVNNRPRPIWLRRGNLERTLEGGTIIDSLRVLPCGQTRLASLLASQPFPSTHATNTCAATATSSNSNSNTASACTPNANTVSESHRLLQLNREMDIAAPGLRRAL